jgi:hypothetical protein
MIYCEDILYSDQYISILKPDINKGILICSENINSLIVNNVYYQKEHFESITYNYLSDYGMIAHEKYINFIVPYYVRDINYTSPKNEILSSYGYSGLSQNKIYIRIDPDNTYIFNKSNNLDDMSVHSSKISLSYYMKKYNNVSMIKQFLFSKSKNYKIIADISKLNAKFCVKCT